MKVGRYTATVVFPYVAVEWLTLLHIQEVSDSNLGPQISHCH